MHEALHQNSYELNTYGRVNDRNKTAIYSTCNGHYYKNKKLLSSALDFQLLNLILKYHSTPLHCPSAIWAARNLKHSNVRRIQMPATPPLNQCFNHWQLLHFCVQNFARPECPALPCPALFLKYLCVEPLEVCHCNSLCQDVFNITGREN